MEALAATGVAITTATSKFSKRKAAQSALGKFHELFVMGHEGIVANCQTGRRGHFGKREWPMQRHGCMKNTVCLQKSEKFCVARTDLVGMLDKVKMKKPAGAMTQRPA